LLAVEMMILVFSFVLATDTNTLKIKTSKIIFFNGHMIL